MRTTLTIDDDVAAKLREETQATGMSFKHTVNDVLRRGLLAKETAAPRPFVVRSRDMGLRPGVELDDIAEVLEQLDGPLYR